MPLTTALRLPVLPALLCALHLASIAAPANDDIDAATPVPVDGTIVTVLAAQATASPDDPGCGTAVHQSLWYRYTSPVDQFIQASAEGVLAPLGQRPRLNAWTRTPTGLVAADCHPDGHEVGFMAAAGETYYLQLHSPVPDGLSSLTLRVIPNAFFNPGEPPAPRNDLLWYAQPLSDLPQAFVADVGAGRGDAAYDPGVCGDPRRGFVLGDSLWYRYTAPADGDVDAMFTSPFSGAYVGVFTGDLDGLQFVACDALGPSRPGAARFHAEAGRSYLIEIAASSEHVFSAPADLLVRPTPAPVGGRIAVQPRVEMYRKRLLIPEIGFEIVTHLRLVVDAECDVPVPAVEVAIAVTQGVRVFRGTRTLNCSAGAGTLVTDLSDARGFKAGLAQVSVSGFDFDTNYQVGSTSTVLVVRVPAP